MVDKLSIRLQGPVMPATPSVDAQFLDTLHQNIQDAHAALRPAVSITPLLHSARLSALTGCEVLLKCEHLQHTGSFKFRGASNKMRLLPACLLYTSPSPRDS